MSISGCILGSLCTTSAAAAAFSSRPLTLVSSGAASHPDSPGLEHAMGFCSATLKEQLRQHAPSIRLSVHDRGAAEAQRHKWIESEKAGRDLGEGAIRCWVRQHWNGFLREKWLEHLEGRTFWIELDHDDFGLLARSFDNADLVGEIVWRLKAGHENLDILNWAIDDNQPMEDVFDILETLDMNSRRIECLLEARLTHLL